MPRVLAAYASTHGHTALGGLIVGSVTQRLLHIAPCPVPVVPVTEKPDAADAAVEAATVNA
jgi:hypothetical protein